MVWDRHEGQVCRVEWLVIQMRYWGNAWGNEIVIGFEITIHFVNVVVEVNLFGTESKVVRDVAASG